MLTYSTKETIVADEDLNPDDLLQIWRAKPVRGEILLLVVRESIPDADLAGLSEVFSEISQETASTMIILKESVFENLEEVNLMELLELRESLDFAITQHLSQIQVGEA